MAARCQGERDPRAIELPILDSKPRIRPSKMGRWRALTLILIHVAVAIHVALWLTKGSALTPVEPSESMQFSTQGIVNAGLVFFALAIASTLILGRWFCGWACHLVALQDLCGWSLTKIGLKPRPVRMGILGVVPWLAFVYMFLAPIADRLLDGQSLAATSQHFFTDDLWRTFPKTLTESLITFAIIGFIIVWLLGAKGFCTYGCPYGGIFGVVDQLAPLRIRVNDACEGCGHCTAVCTSNVNVAREVREYGMVVDPGCMKCMDCVSVCPNDALRVGWGVPAMFARARVKIAEKATPWARHILLFVFTFAALSTFTLHDGVWDLRFVLGVSAFAFVVAFLFRSRARRAPDYTFAEELLLAGVFLFAMLSFRGLFDAVPFLFSLGLSAILAWSLVQGVRLIYASDVKLQNVAFKAGKRWTASGVAFAAVLVPIGGLWVYGFRSQQVVRADRWTQRHATADDARRIDDSRKAYNRGVTAGEAGQFEQAIHEFQSALELDPHFIEARENLAGMLCASGKLSEGLAQYELALVEHPTDPDTHALAARAALELGDVARALKHLEEAVRLAPERAELREFLDETQKRVQGSSGEKH